LRDAGDPAELVARYDGEGADEVVFLDITASSDERNILLDTVERTAEQLFIPLTVGGGVRTVDDARTLLRAGADKVGINSAAVAQPALIDGIAEEFGAQCVVVAVDVRGEEVYVHGGRTATGCNVFDWIVEAARRGAGEILLTSMDRDGTRSGYDVELLRKVTDTVDVPVVASGGVGSLDDLVDGARAGADAVLAASIFHFGEHSVADAKAALSSAGFNVRPAY
jgi:imidazole glycerol-phosphate synthase subunit HisF